MQIEVSHLFLECNDRPDTASADVKVIKTGCFIPFRCSICAVCEFKNRTRVEKE